MPTHGVSYKTVNGQQVQVGSEDDPDSEGYKAYRPPSKVSTAPLGVHQKSAAGMPKQEPGEDPAAYAARVRKWREGRAQQDALMSMKKD